MQGVGLEFLSRSCDSLPLGEIFLGCHSPLFRLLSQCYEHGLCTKCEAVGWALLPLSYFPPDPLYPTGPYHHPYIRVTWHYPGVQAFWKAS